MPNTLLIAKSHTYASKYTDITIYLHLYQSSITGWVDILTKPGIAEEAYDGSVHAFLSFPGSPLTARNNTEYLNWSMQLIFSHKQGTSLCFYLNATFSDGAIKPWRGFTSSSKEVEARNSSPTVPKSCCACLPCRPVRPFDSFLPLQLLKALVENCGEKFKSNSFQYLAAIF